MADAHAETVNVANFVAYKPLDMTPTIDCAEAAKVIELVRLQTIGTDGFFRHFSSIMKKDISPLELAQNWKRIASFLPREWHEQSKCEQANSIGWAQRTERDLVIECNYCFPEQSEKNETC